MRRQSSSARAVASERRDIRWGLLGERGAACEGCPLTPVGSDPARVWTDMHEVLTRGRGGDPTDKENILCLCRICHSWVTTHEVEARALGLVRARTAEEHQKSYRPWLAN